MAADGMNHFLDFEVSEMIFRVEPLERPVEVEIENRVKAKIDGVYR